MSKRKYTHIQELEEEILRMRQEGGTRQEIADRLGLNKSQIKIGSPGIIGDKQSWQQEFSPGRKEGREKRYTPRHCCGAGLRDPAFAYGKRVAAGFSAIHRKEVKAKAKYAVIYRHREQYPVLVMCRFFPFPEAAITAF